METFSALLALCAANSPVTSEFPTQRPVTRNFDVFFDLRLNKQLSKQSWGWWFETPSCSLFTEDKATLVQVMAWCHQGTSDYLNQCWPRSLSPYDVTRPQLVKNQQKIITLLSIILPQQWCNIVMSEGLSLPLITQCCNCGELFLAEAWSVDQVDQFDSGGSRCQCLKSNGTHIKFNTKK